VINLNPKKFPELQGCKTFGFHAHLKTNLYSHYATVNFTDLVRQAAAAGYIQGIIEVFKTLPCEVNIRVGTRKGVAFVLGEVNAPGRTSFENAGLIIAALAEQVESLAKIYPKSSFSIKARQSIEFHNIQR